MKAKMPLYSNYKIVRRGHSKHNLENLINDKHNIIYVILSILTNPQKDVHYINMIGGPLIIPIPPD